MATYSYEYAYVLKLRGNCVAYLRTSQRPQSKLNMAAQRDAINALIAERPARLVTTFVEYEPLINKQRPALEKAVALCKAKKATLVIGKIERMRGSRRWIEFICSEGVQFIGADVPGINSASLWRFEYNEKLLGLERGRKIAEALANTKAQGVALGGKRENAEGLKLGPAASAISRRRNAMKLAEPIMSEIRLLRHRGITSLTAIATRLNQMGHCAPRGGKWSAAQVRSVIKKFKY